jgi:hypothetical protein
MGKTISVMSICFVLGVAGLAHADGLSAELKFARSLSKHRPVDPGETFEPGKVYAWTLIEGGKGTFEVQHLWYKNGKRVYQHTVQVRGSRYPTWSFLIASPGKYRVEVADGEGKVFQSGELTVR